MCVSFSVCSEKQAYKFLKHFIKIKIEKLQYCFVFELKWFTPLGFSQVGTPCRYNPVMCSKFLARPRSSLGSSGTEKTNLGKKKFLVTDTNVAAVSYCPAKQSIWFRLNERQKHRLNLKHILNSFCVCGFGGFFFF